MTSAYTTRVSTDPNEASRTAFGRSGHGVGQEVHRADHSCHYLGSKCLVGKQKVPATNYDVTSFTLNLTEAGVNYTDVVATGVSILQRPCKRKKNCKRSRNQLVSNHSWQLLPRSNLLPARQRTEQDAPDSHPRHRRRPQLLGPAHQQL